MKVSEKEESDKLLRLYEQAMKSYRYFDKFNSKIASTILTAAGVILGAGILRSLAKNITFEFYLLLLIPLVAIVMALVYCVFKIALRSFSSKKLALKMAGKVEERLSNEFRLAKGQLNIEKNSLVASLENNKILRSAILVIGGIVLFFILVFMYY